RPLAAAPLVVQAGPLKDKPDVHFVRLVVAAITTVAAQQQAAVSLCSCSSFLAISILPLAFFSSSCFYYFYYGSLGWHLRSLCYDHDAQISNGEEHVKKRRRAECCVGVWLVSVITS
ncbi:unnamed protein product, partial [Heterosigma akashiwo]